MQPENHTTDLYWFKKLERVEGQGMLVYYDGALYPARGFPTEKIFEAVYFIKRTLRESIRFPLLFLHSNKTLIQSFNLIGQISIGRALHPNYLLCPAALKIQKIITVFLIEIGIEAQEANTCAMYIAQIFEHDNAYRYRVQDLASEANEYALTTDPKREVQRLLDLAIQREGGNNPIIRKLKLVKRAVSFVLSFPKYKRAFKTAMMLGLDGLRYDRQDWYWVCQRGDYAYGGLPKGARMKEFDIYPKLYTLEELKSLVQ